MLTDLFSWSTKITIFFCIECNTMKIILWGNFQKWFWKRKVYNNYILYRDGLWFQLAHLLILWTFFFDVIIVVLHQDSYRDSRSFQWAVFMIFYIILFTNHQNSWKSFEKKPTGTKINIRYAYASVKRLWTQFFAIFQVQKSSLRTE